LSVQQADCTTIAPEKDKLTSTDLLTLFKYNSWANHRILEHAARLTPEQVHAPAAMDHGSAFQTLLHMVDVEWSWRIMSTNTVAREYVWEMEALPDLASLDRFWRMECARMLAYVGSLDKAALEQEVDFGSLQGQKPRSARVRQILLHVVTHSGHHRSEMARRLTECGHSPGDLALLNSL
jgi:uncharacterized damage-inducible protein DinB